MKKLPLALALTLAVVLIGQGLLSVRRSSVRTATNKNRTGESAALTQENQSGKAQALASLGSGQPKPVVVKRGKRAIQPEEMVNEAVAQSAERFTEGANLRSRLSSEEAREERERERKKGRYAYLGRLPKYAAQALGAPQQDKPVEQRLTRGGRVFLGDLRNLPKTKPIPRERPELEGPAFNPREIQRAGQPAPPSVKLNVPQRIAAAAPAALTGFEGLDRFNWGAGSPPDTNGDVGPTYYIQTVNTSVGIFDKSNGNLVTAFTFDTLMSQGNFGNQCDNHNFGDPVVLYDTFEDRWVLTDFAFTLDGSGNVNPPIAFQCFAVSRTGDPVMGGWNFYSTTVTDGLNDYPKFGVWTDGIYMSANLFGYPAGSSFIKARAWAFNKAQMYAGAPTVQSVSFDIGGGDFTVIPSNARLQVGTPPPGRPNLFLSTSQFLNAVGVYKFHVDWNRISLSSFTGPDTPLASTSWPNASVAGVPQSGTSQLLDALGTRAMVQNQYTNYGGNESLWATHTVRRASGGSAAPRWYQVSVTGGTVAANLPQAATWDPDVANTNHRWMPSLALDRVGNLAMGYSISSSTTFPSFAYAGRLASDAANTFSQTEQMLFTGTASQLSSSRWGDYSSMTLDPNGCTFWYTTEYATGLDTPPVPPATLSPGFNMRWKTRVNSFSYASIGQCTPVGAGGTVAGTVSATVGGAPISGATVALGSRTATTDGAGFYQFTNIPAGTYPSITASAPAYNSQTFTSIVVTDGATTTQNFSLDTALANGCLTDTTQADFQTGVGTSIDLTTSPGDVTLSNAPTIDQQNTAGTTTGTGVISNASWAGQTFTAGVNGQLVKVDFPMFCSSNPAGTPCTLNPNLTVSIRATSGGLPTGADLASTSIAGNISGSTATFTATFASPPTITAGTQYVLIVNTGSTGAASTGYFWIRSSPSTYASGQRVSSANSGGTWTADTTRDYNFKTYMQTGYTASGNLVSGTKDANPAAGLVPVWGTFSWTAATPANTGLQFQVAASNNANGPFTFVGPDNTAGTFFTTSGASLNQFNGLRYLKYKAYLSTTDNAVTPTLNDVTICYVNSVPATVAGGGTICAGGSTNVTVTVSGGTPPYTVVLSNSGGSQTGAGPVFTIPVGPMSDTTYTLAAGSHDANNVPLIGSGSATVTVTPLPPTPTITPDGPTTFCAGGSVTLNSSSASGNQWYLNGSPIGGATGQTYNATASGSYTVVVTASGCPSAPSAPTVVTVNPLPPTPTITPGGPTTFCQGGSVTLTSSSATGNQWYLNGNPIGGATNQTYSATASGSYTVVVTASGCASAPSAPLAVTVNPIPPTPTITPGGPTTFCAGGNVTLTSSSATGNQWYLNGNLIGGATGQTYSATGAGSYTVVVTTNGCSSAASAPVTVVVNPIPPTPTVTPNGPTTFCPGGNVTLTSSSLTGNQWYLNGNAIAGATNQTYLAMASGSYTVVVTASGCGSTASAPVTVTISSVTVNPPSLPGGTVGTPYNQIMSVTPAATYSFSVTSGVLPGGLSLHPTTGALTGTPNSNGTFNFTITATNGGCSGSRNYSLTIGCSSLSFTPASLPNAEAGVAYNQTVSVPGATSYQVLTGNLPPGLTLNAATGSFSGTATATGTYNFTLQVTANGGCSASQAYSIVVNCPTVAVNPTNATLTAGTVGTAYSQIFSATPTSSYSFAKSSGTLPPGLNLSAAGVLSGTPTTAGTYTFTVTATGFGTCTGNRQYTVTISANCATITLPDLPATGKVGQQYTGNLAATTPSAAYTFTVDSGALPPGLAIDNLFATLSGKPTAVGTYNFTLKATRSNGCTGTKAYTVVISSPLVALAQVSDYDGDKKSDLSLFAASAGAWRILPSATQTPVQQSWGGTGDVTLLGDYDGDGKTDIAIFRPADATFYIQRSSNGSALIKQLGAGTDVPVEGDYDGDGKTDLAVWRGTTGFWYILRSSDGRLDSVSWGTSVAPYLDVPVPADYDGDGKTDLAVFRRQTGTWLIRRSRDGQYLTQTWGMGTDVPVAGDYDGDGKADVAVWRGTTGQWFVLRSTDQGYDITAWGAASAGDVPVAGDYDGDGRSDLAVWRAGTSTWYIKCTASDTVITKEQGPATARPSASRPR